jgi:hypothetical protein
MKRLMFLLAAAAAVLAWAADGRAAVIASYDAARDSRPELYADNPTAQGWTSYNNTLGDPTLNTPGHVAGPVDVNGVYQGTDAPLAWRINDQGSAAPQYRQPITSHLDLMASNPAGWKLESDVRFNTSTYQLGFYVADADWDLGSSSAYWFRVVSSAPTAGNLVLNIGAAGNVNTGIAYDPSKFYNVVLESVFANPFRYTVTIDGTKLADDFAPLGYTSAAIQGALFGSNSSGGTGIVGDMASYQLTAPCRRVLYSHYGSNDPVGDEGWTQVGTPSAGLYAEAVTNDGGYDAWKVIDSTSAGALNYQYDLTPAMEEILLDNGWIMRGRIRVEDDPNSIDSAVSMQVALSPISRVFNLGLSLDGQGNTLFGFNTSGSDFTTVSGSVEGTGYHLYEMVFDPTDHTVSLFVDGDEKISGFGGRSYSGLHRVLFGANSSAGTGTGYYNMVEFIVVPEPGSLVLLLSLALATLTVRARRCR